MKVASESRWNSEIEYWETEAEARERAAEMGASGARGWSGPAWGLYVGLWVVKVFTT